MCEGGVPCVLQASSWPLQSPVQVPWGTQKPPLLSPLPHAHTPLLPSCPSGGVLLRVPLSYSAFPGGSRVDKAVQLSCLCSPITSRLLLRLLPASGPSQFLDLKALSSPGLYLNLLERLPRGLAASGFLLHFKLKPNPA